MIMFSNDSIHTNSPSNRLTDDLLLDQQRAFEVVEKNAKKKRDTLQVKAFILNKFEIISQVAENVEKRIADADPNLDLSTQIC
jgi:hypothetical protein